MNTILGQNYWNKRYQNRDTAWDMQQVSPPFKHFIDHLTDPNISILIPGCGRAYEAQYLLERGFQHITLIDISQVLCEDLTKVFQHAPSVQILCEDFFMHEGTYDYIFEQTFFCALTPNLRSPYVKKMHDLLAVNGALVGLLFQKTFASEGPPFGGNRETYLPLFTSVFKNIQMQPCHHSHPARMGSELWIHVSH